MPLELSSETLTSSRPTEASITTITEPVKEGETAVYTVQLTGPGGAAIANTQFTAMTLTYIDEETHSVINSRNVQDVFGAGMLGDNNHTVSAAALLTWNLQTADTEFVDPTGTRSIEFHRAIYTFDFDIGAGTERGIHEVRIPIRKGFTALTQSSNP